MIKNGFKIVTSGIILTITFTLLSSCVDDPEFPDTPRIEFKSVFYVEQGNGNPFDSLTFSIDFEDGDGDLGFSEADNLNPNFSIYKVFDKNNGQEFQAIRSFTGGTPQEALSLLEEILLESILVASDPVDSLPDYNSTSACFNYAVNPSIPIAVVSQNGTVSTEQVQVNDTVYIQFNERHYNFIVDLFEERNGNFELINWRNRFECETLNGRISDQIKEGLEDDTPVEGTITNSIVVSAPLNSNFVFGNNRLKLRIFLIDRAGNQSNIVESAPFTLNEIKVN